MAQASGADRSLVSGACMTDTLLPLLIGLFWGLALAGVLAVWTTEAILAVWATEERDEQS